MRNLKLNTIHLFASLIVLRITFNRMLLFHRCFFHTQRNILQHLWWFFRIYLWVCTESIFIFFVYRTLSFIPSAYFTIRFCDFWVFIIKRDSKGNKNRYQICRLYLAVKKTFRYCYLLTWLGGKILCWFPLWPLPDHPINNHSLNK